MPTDTAQRLAQLALRQRLHLRLFPILMARLVSDPELRDIEFTYDLLSPLMNALVDGLAGYILYKRETHEASNANLPDHPV